MTILEHGYKINELFRRINNLVRVGCVIDVDYSAAKARVQIGKVRTKPMPWLVPSTSAWIPLKVGEQVLVLSPNGDTAFGVILPALYHEDKPAPSSHSQKIHFDNNLSVSGTITNGNTNLSNHTHTISDQSNTTGEPQ